MPYKYPNPPKVRIREILKWMQKSKKEVFTSLDLVGEFGITLSDAGNRLQRMRSYGWVMFEDKKRPIKYRLTGYGRRFIE